MWMRCVSLYADIRARGATGCPHRSPGWDRTRPRRLGVEIFSYRFKTFGLICYKLLRSIHVSSVGVFCFPTDHVSLMTIISSSLMTIISSSMILSNSSAVLGKISRSIGSMRLLQIDSGSD